MIDRGEWLGDIGLPVVEVRRERVTPGLLDMVEAIAEAASTEVVRRRAKLDRLTYLSMGERYGLWLLTAADLIVGFCGMLLLPDPRTGESTASQDAIYVRPRWRAHLGRRLIERVDRDLLESGVVIVYRQAPSSRDIGPLYRRLGYEQVETVHARRLRPRGDGHR